MKGNAHFELGFLDEIDEPLGGFEPRIGDKVGRLVQQLAGKAPLEALLQAPRDVFEHRILDDQVEAGTATSAGF